MLLYLVLELMAEKGSQSTYHLLYAALMIFKGPGVQHSNYTL